MLNYDVPATKNMHLVPKFDKLQVIEKSVLNYASGEEVRSYKCKLGNKTAWIHYDVIEAFFDVENDYDGSKQVKRKKDDNSFLLVD